MKDRILNLLAALCVGVSITSVLLRFLEMGFVIEEKAPLHFSVGGNARFGIDFRWHGSNPAEGPWLDWGVRYRTLAVLFLLPALWRAQIIFRRRGLAAKGHCQACGYDLRASPIQC